MPNLNELKNKFQIAIIDDESFVRESAIRSHGFRLIHLGGDIRSINEVAEYPIIVCDIKGVAKAFESKFEGAHLISEIKKAYPDKYIIAYTGSTYDATYNDKLSFADIVAPKDMSTEYWVKSLEDAIAYVGDPKERWLRLRSTFLEKGVDLFDVFKLEQAFVKSINKRDSGIFTNKSNELVLKDETKELVKNFAATALTMIIKGYIDN